MQSPHSVLALLLCALALCSQVLSVPYGADTPTACCFSYISRSLPRKAVVSYFETSSLCSSPGIIFHTIRDRQVCTDPRKSWVQDLIKAMEKDTSQAGGSEVHQ